MGVLTSMGTDCQEIQNFPLLSAAQRESRTNLVRLMILYSLNFLLNFTAYSLVVLFICVFGSVGEQYLSSSNYMDSISMSGSNGCSLSSSLKGTDLPELFSTLGLGKYTDIFQQQEVILDLHVQKEIPMFPMQF